MTATHPQSVGDKRAAILDAALTLFTERGFHGTAVPQLAELAGVGAGTIYRYFESKEAIVNALYQREKTAVSGAVLGDFDFEAPFRQQFHQLWQRWTRWATENPRAFTFLELHHHASYLDDASRGMEERIIDLTVQIVKKAQADRIVKPVAPHVLMGLIYGAFVGLIRLSRERNETLTPDDIEAAERCCWEAIRL